MQRRSFLKVSTTATGSLMVALSIPSLGKEVKNGSWSPDAITEIHIDGGVTFTLTKHEMGQGTGTGVPMVFCDELGADWGRLRVIQGDFNQAKYGRLQGNTGGSSGVRLMWEPVRELAAMTRETLKEAAARKWNLDRTDLETRNGFVYRRGSDKKVAFEELLDEAADIRLPSEDIQFKDPSEYYLIGTHQTNLITPKIVRGEKMFAGDLQVPDMVFAAIERCPVYRGKVKSFDDSEARKVSGVLDVISIPEFYEDQNFIVREGVAVIANSTWAAFQGKKALKIEWSGLTNGERSNETLRQEMIDLSGESGEPVGRIWNYGDVEQAKTEADRVISSTYENAYHAHACMEPMNAIASATATSCEIWAPMQSPDKASARLKDHLNIPVENQTIHIKNSGGSFGRKYYPDYILEATYLSQQVGRPVKLTWTREDDIRCDLNSDFQHDIHQVAIKDNKVTGWHIKVLPTDRGTPYPWVPYYVPNKLGESIPIESPLTVGAWRSVGPHRAAFGLECMVDEVAHELGKDPYEFRLELLELPSDLSDGAAEFYNHERSVTDRKQIKAVLNSVAQRSGWGRKMPSGTGLGMAMYRFGYAGSYCAHVVEVDTREGELKIPKVTSALYCGTAVNPHFVQGQIEGSVIWALTSVLYGGMDFENGQVKQSNFHDYKMLRMHETPDVDLEIVNNEGPAFGTGEPGVPPFTPALMNAIFAATGKRIRKTPLKKEDWT